MGYEGVIHIENKGGGGGLKNPADFLQLKTGITPQPNAEGLIQWNATENTVDVGLEGGVVTGQLFEENFIRGVNKTASTLTEGQVVYTPGRQGNKPKFDLARGDSEATSMALGVLTMDIPINGFGRCTTFGYVRQIKTNYTGTGIRGTTWADGDKLYVSKTTAGQLTNIEPSAPHHSDCIATVSIVGSAGVGAIFVNIDRHKTLEELSDVNGTAPVEGSIPVWNDTSKYFDFTAKIGDYLKINQTTPQITVGRFQFPNIAVDTNLIYTDSVNKRVGIGTTNPQSILHIKSATPIKFTKNDNNETSVFSIDRPTGVKMFEWVVSGLNEDYLYLRDEGTDNILSISRSGSLNVQGSISAGGAIAPKILGIGRPSDTTYLTRFLSEDTYGSYYHWQTHIDVDGWKDIVQWDRNRTYFNILTDKVGIGTSSPRQKLDVGGTIVTIGASLPSFAANGSIISSGSGVSPSKGVLVGVSIPYVAGAFGGHTLGYSNQANPKWLIGLSRNIANENALVYYEDSAAAYARLTIMPGGNVGIGTTTPNSKLDVNGTIKATDYKSSDGSTGATGSFTTTDLKTVTVKNGLIVSIV